MHPTKQELEFIREFLKLGSPNVACIEWQKNKGPSVEKKRIKVPDEEKPLISVEQAKGTSRIRKGTQQLKLHKTKANKDFKQLVVL